MAWTEANHADRRAHCLEDEVRALTNKAQQIEATAKAALLAGHG